MHSNFNHSKQMYRGAQHGQLTDERGFLLPFLAGVLVTAPFAIFAKNNQSPYYPYPPQLPPPTYVPVYPQAPYPPMSYPYPPYPYR